jgi:hypothetical protein
LIVNKPAESVRLCTGPKVASHKLAAAKLDLSSPSDGLPVSYRIVQWVSDHPSRTFGLLRTEKAAHVYFRPLRGSSWTPASAEGEDAERLTFRSPGRLRDTRFRHFFLDPVESSSFRFLV